MTQSAVRRLPVRNRKQMSSAFTTMSARLLFLLLHVSIRASAGSQHPSLLVISFDGFRSDYLQEKTTPNLYRMAASGASAKSVQPRFMSKTFPNHMSIASGLYEESHGIVGNEFFDPDLNDTFRLGDTDAKWWDVGAVPIWVLNDEAGNGRVSGGIMWPGTEGLIHNRTANYVVPYNGSMPWEQRVDIAIDWFLNGDTQDERNLGPANCIFLYFEQPDKAGHKFGPNSPQVALEVQRVDDLVGYLFGQLRSKGLDTVNVIITSDHGMSEVPDENFIVLDRTVNSSAFRTFGTSPVLNILPNTGEEDYVYNTLLNASRSMNFSVYKREDVPEEYFYKRNRRISPIVVVADDGWDVSATESNWAKSNNGQTFLNVTLTGIVIVTNVKVWWRLLIAGSGVHGNHGYNNSLPSMQVPFVGHGPAFRPRSVNAPFANIDLFPLMCHILGLSPPPNNGSLENVRAILRHPPGIDINDTIFQVTVIILVACLSTGVLVAIFSICGKRRAKKRIDLESSDTSPALAGDSNSTVEGRPLLS